MCVPGGPPAPELPAAPAFAPLPEAKLDDAGVVPCLPEVEAASLQAKPGCYMCELADHSRSTGYRMRC